MTMTSSDNSPAHGAQPSTTEQTGILQKMLTMMLEDNRRREKQQRRDTWFKRIAIGLLVAASLAGYYTFFRTLVGSGSGGATDGPTLAVIQVRGAIMPDSKLSSGGRVSAAIMAAAKDENVKKIVLYIESPGGAPVEAERIAQTVNFAREKHKKPIVAVIGNLGASAGYMVALSADEIVSGQYSLVGSIGAVIQSWQLDGLLARLDVKAKSYTSGELKALLNPFEPGTEKGAKKAQDLVNTLGAQFADLVAERRAGKLTQDISAYTSGEVWNGAQALKLGLVDANGTLESVAAATPELEMVNFGPFENKGLIAPLLGAVQDGVSRGVQALAEPTAINLR